MVILMHIPYYFFTTKEYALVTFDEMLNRSLSTHLENKLADFYKRHPDKIGASSQKEEHGDSEEGEENDEVKPLL